MANVRNGNTYYIDTDGEGLEEKNQAVVYIILTATGGAALLELGDNISGATYPIKVAIKAEADTTKHLILNESAMIFPNGIYVKTATNCQATLLLRTPNGTQGA